MLTYNLRLALRSLRRNPVLSVLLVGAIGLGIAVSTTFVTAHYILAKNPIPHKSDVLHYVEMDNWDPNRPWDDQDPKAVPNQVTYRDMVEAMKSDIPTYRGGSFRASVFIHPDPKVGRPFKAVARMCFADFFRMFEPPFDHGSGWDRNVDNGPEPVIVLSQKTNQKLFGGENSVGRTVRVEDREFKVVGILQEWRPIPKYYDPHNGAFEDPEELYMPFGLFRPLKLRSNGNTSNWKSVRFDDPEAFLASEAIWIQLWVQLDTPAQKEAYLSYLNSYVEGQKKSGRMLRPTNNKLLPVMEWLEQAKVVPSEATNLLVISLLFLAVCALNLIGILMGKFLARAPEVSVRRALGASRRSIFLQHVIECETVGVLGGITGVFLAMAGLEGINRMFDNMVQFRLDLNMLLVSVGLSLVAGLIAGLYPAWRICAIPPAAYLREQ